MFTLPRRTFLAGLAATTAATAASRFAFAQATSPFRVAVINDEISQDFARACEVASKEFGMGWIELRGMWKKNIVALDEKEIAETRSLLGRFQLKVTDIASPLFKVGWPGAPKSKFSEGKSFNADFTMNQQDEVLERAIAMAKAFGTDRVRCFDFWRIDDQAPYREAMNDKLREAAAKAEKHGIILVLENEQSCNTATAHEAVKGHCHCKDAVKKGEGYDWAPMGGGMIDWAGQYKALKRDGYHLAVSLETHWNGGGSPEESSRKSWAGMKKLLQEADAL